MTIFRQTLLPDILPSSGSCPSWRALTAKHLKQAPTGFACLTVCPERQPANALGPAIRRTFCRPGKMISSETPLAPCALLEAAAIQLDVAFNKTGWRLLPQQRILTPPGGIVAPTYRMSQGGSTGKEAGAASSVATARDLLDTTYQSGTQFFNTDVSRYAHQQILLGSTSFW